MKSVPKPPEEFPKAAKARLKTWAPALSDVQLDVCEIYIRELLHFNKTLNLISPNTVPKLDAVHILDVIKAWSLIEPRIPAGSLIFDFGTGNGLPGLLAAGLSPDRTFRLVDRDQRKLEFCKHLISALGLKNVTTACMDIADLPEGSVKFAISRGFASVLKSMLLTRSSFALGGAFFMMKGESWSHELSELPPALFRVWKSEMVGEYKLPDNPGNFVVLQSIKTAE